MSDKHLIVFDIDGTLTDSAELHGKAFVKAIKKLGVEEINHSFYEFEHHTDHYIAKYIYEAWHDHEFDTTKLDLIEQELHAEMKQAMIKEIEGAIALLDFLESHPNYHFSFATGSLLAPAKLKMEALNRPSSALLSTSNKHESRESIVRDSIEKARAEYGSHDYKTITAVGDGMWDLRTARNLELNFVGIGEKYKEELTNLGMEKHFNHCADYLEEFKRNEN